MRVVHAHGLQATSCKNTAFGTSWKQSWKQKRAKVKAPTTATQEDDKECHKILQRQDSYRTKVKALKYLEFTQDTIGHQKVMEKLSAPRIKYQTTRIMQEAQDMHNNGSQSVLRDRHSDGIWYRRVGKGEP